MYKAWMFKQRSFHEQLKGDGDLGGSGGSGGKTDDQGGEGDDKGDDKGGDEGGSGGDDKSKKPTDAEAKLIKEVMQRKEALKKTEQDLADATARLKEFEGVDPAKIRKLLADQAAAEEAQLAAKGEFDTLRARMADEHTRVTTGLQEQITALQAQLVQKDKVVDELSIGTQFSQSKFITDESTMTPAKARKVFGDHFDVVDGKVVAYDKPRGEANRAPLVDQLGNGIGFEDAMRKIVEADPDKDHLLKSKVKPGAGSETKKTDGKPKVEPSNDSVSKIGAGLKGLNLLAQKGM